MRGKSGKCPKCGQKVNVPKSNATKTAAVTNNKSTTQEVNQASSNPAVKQVAIGADRNRAVQKKEIDGNVLIAGLANPIQPVRRSPVYMIGLMFATLVMVLLPLLYVALIGLTIYGVYYHVTEHVGIMGAAGSGRGAFFMVLVYVAPIVIGSICVVFMIKPLFARPVRNAASRSLRREGEPVLFAFVDRLCEVVAAPKPERIEVDYELNASASFSGGMAGLFRSKLVLTIGVPLAAGLSVRQLTGVLAHEFGHFSQGMGMRLTYVVRFDQPLVCPRCLREGSVGCLVGRCQ